MRVVISLSARHILWKRLRCDIFSMYANLFTWNPSQNYLREFFEHLCKIEAVEIARDSAPDRALRVSVVAPRRSRCR